MMARESSHNTKTPEYVAPSRTKTSHRRAENLTEFADRGCYVTFGEVVIPTIAGSEDDADRLAMQTMLLSSGSSSRIQVPEDSKV